MTTIKIIIENDLGECITVNSYELGSEFNKMDKLEQAVMSVSSAMLTDITSTVLALEEQHFLKKTTINATEVTP